MFRLQVQSIKIRLSQHTVHELGRFSKDKFNKTVRILLGIDCGVVVFKLDGRQILLHKTLETCCCKKGQNALHTETGKFPHKENLAPPNLKAQAEPKLSPPK